MSLLGANLGSNRPLFQQDSERQRIGSAQEPSFFLEISRVGAALRLVGVANAGRRDCPEATVFPAEEIDFPPYRRKGQGNIINPLNRVSKGILCGQLLVLDEPTATKTFPLTSQLFQRNNTRAKKTLADRLADS
jgi:hypothetical protein